MVYTPLPPPPSLTYRRPPLSTRLPKARFAVSVLLVALIGAGKITGAFEFGSSPPRGRRMFRLASVGAATRICGGPRPTAAKVALMSTSAGGGDESSPLSTQRLASLLIHGPDSESSGRADAPHDDALSRLASSLPAESPSLPPPKMSAVLALSGGGVRSSTALATTPGSSSILRECVFPYDRASFAEFASSHPLPPREVAEEAASDIGAATNGDGTGKKGFSFASTASAVLLSNAALHRSMELSGTLGEMRGCVGVGCSAMLVSSGDTAKRSTVRIAVSAVDGTTALIEADLSAEGGGASSEKDEGGGVGMRRRNRVEEDEAASVLLLLAMIKDRYGDGETAFGEAADAVLDRDGDSWTKRVVRSPVSGASSPLTDDDGLDQVRHSARGVVSGASPAALLLPTPKAFSARNSSFSPLAVAHAVLPPDPLIFPGSFNPPHVGHVALANAAVKAMERKRKAEWRERERGRAGLLLGAAAQGGGRSFLSTADSDVNSERGGGSFSEGGEVPSETAAPTTLLDGVWSAVEYHNHKSAPSIVFEMSLTNPDKPPMDEDEAARRVGLFGRCLDTADAAVDEDGGSVQMPPDWGVLLTSAPLFVEKVAALGGILAPNRASYGNGKPAEERQRKMTFVIGTDTMVRIINPKYYGGSYDSMLGAVREMGDAGAHFVVGGRLEQGTGGEGEENQFVTGEEDLQSLPNDVQDMFTIIQEEDFRLDLSSTELRKRALSS